MVRDKTRKGYYYAPIPLEIIEVLDNLVNEEGIRYGIDGRAEMVRNVLGTFVQLYEMKGPGSLNAVKNMIINTKNGNTKKGDSNNNHDISPPPSLTISVL